jgi:hypothetical protein
MVVVFFAGLFVFRALLALGVLADPFLLRIALDHGF